MSVIQPPSLRSLTAPVAVEIRSKDECVDHDDLAGFSCHDGPAAKEVRMIVGNLLSGEALQQTVAMIRDTATGTLVGLVSVRMDGNAQIRTKSGTPWFLRRISVNPYVNLLARDERYRGHLLADGTTGIGAALLRAGLELIANERGGSMPSVWALVKRENAASKRAFSQFAFHLHDRHRRTSRTSSSAVPASRCRPAR